MADASRSFLSSMPARLIGSVVVIGLVAILMMKPTRDPIIDPDEPDVATQPADNRCDQALARIIDVLQPGRLSVQSTSEDLATEFNGWFTTCGIDETEGLTADQEILQEVLSEQALLIASNERYGPADVDHVRFSLLASQIIREVAKDALSDTEQVIALFDFVTRYVSLIPDDAESPIPMTPYESLLVGYSTASGRAWTFASLLQQLRLDAMIIAPASQEKSAHWLVGVDVPKEGILLFDPHVGLPMPGPDDDQQSPFPTSVATLSEVRSDDDLLRQFDSESEAYPLESGDLEEVEVQLIGSPILRSNRMAELQWVFPEQVDVFDGLGKNILREPGEFKRIESVGERLKLWSKDDMSDWNVPTEQLMALNESRLDEVSPYSKMIDVMAGPTIVKFDLKSGGVLEMPVENPLHVIRLQLLRGDQSDALKNMGRILTAYSTNPTELNDDAVTFAQLWIGLAQVETKNYTAALSTFDRFVSTPRTPQSEVVLVDVMNQTAQNWKALSHVLQKDISEAIRVISEKTKTSSAVRDAYLIKRWTSQVDSKTESSDE